jgi:hypothetical protein
MVAASLWLYSGDSECRVVPVWQEACRPDAVRFWLLGCSNKHHPPMRRMRVHDM